MASLPPDPRPDDGVEIEPEPTGPYHVVGDRGVVAENLVLLRKDRGLSQERLANNAFLTRETVRAIEMGRADPKLSTLEQLALALNTTVKELVDPNLPKEFEDGLATPSKLAAKAGRRSTSPDQPIQAPLVVALAGR